MYRPEYVVANLDMVIVRLAALCHRLVDIYNVQLGV